jgi:hypothetical protein
MAQITKSERRTLAIIFIFRCFFLRENLPRQRGDQKVKRRLEKYGFSIPQAEDPSWRAESGLRSLDKNRLAER